MNGSNIIDVNVANIVTITIMAAIGMALAAWIVKGLKARRDAG